MRRAERRSKQKPRRTTPQPRHSAPQARRHAACPRTRVSSANRRPRAHARRRSTTQDNGAPRAPRRCGVVFPDQVAQSARPWQRSAESRRRICAGRARRDGAPLCRRGARRRRSARRQSQATEPWGEPAAAPSQERSAHGDFGGPSPPVCDGCDAADAQRESGYAWRRRRACLPHARRRQRVLGRIRRRLAPASVPQFAASPVPWLRAGADARGRGRAPSRLQHSARRPLSTDGRG